MDKRKSHRRFTTANVVVKYDSLGLVSGKIRDVSEGGMYVQTGRVVIPPNAAVEAYLRLRGNGKDERLVMQARVARVDMDGLALMFPQPDVTLVSRITA